MSSATLWFGCLALLLMGASLMLWAESVRRREREASRSFVRVQTEQINARYQPNAEVAPVSVPDSLTRPGTMRCAAPTSSQAGASTCCWLRRRW